LKTIVKSYYYTPTQRNTYKGILCLGQTFAQLSETKTNTIKLKTLLFSYKKNWQNDVTNI